MDLPCIKEAEAERAAQENAQQQVQQRFNDYQVWQNVPNGLSSATGYQINIPLQQGFRAQALSMAIEHHKNCGHGDVAEMAAKFLAFLKGDANV